MPLKKVSRPNKPAKNLSARDKLIQCLRAYNERKSKASEVSNAANRQRTLLKHALTAWLREENLPQGTSLVIDGLEISYDVASSEKITADKWFHEFQDGNITQEQFISCLSVNIAQVKKEAGEDRVLALKTTVVGKNADIRIKPAEDNSKDIIIKEKSKIEKPVTQAFSVSGKKRKLGIKLKRRR